ncbi:MAG: cytochrome c [Anaerolineae bacterium]|nr:cytochrome c [Anaerolineae bacterium]
MKKLLFLILGLLLIVALALSACGGRDRPEQVTFQEQGDPAKGKELFTAACTACHGPQGKGVPGLGKDMTQSQFIAGKTDKELVEFIKKGREADDPLNETGVLMPPRGGNPALTEQNLYSIVAYIRTLQE